MGQSPSLEAGNLLGHPGIFRLLWSPRFNFRGHGSPLLVSVLSDEFSLYRQLHAFHYTFPFDIFPRCC